MERRRERNREDEGGEDGEGENVETRSRNEEEDETEREEEEEQIKTGIRSLHDGSSMWRSNMGREAGGETGVEAVHRQARQRERDLPAHFTWTSVRPDRVTVRERERDSETDT